MVVLTILSLKWGPIQQAVASRTSLSPKYMHSMVFYHFFRGTDLADSPTCTFTTLYHLGSSNLAAHLSCFSEAEKKILSRESIEIQRVNS